ncbi:MAG: TonB family protein [Azonexus sp.]|nr:TonB family protein [Azonexus sp.]
MLFRAIGISLLLHLMVFAGSRAQESRAPPFVVLGVLHATLISPLPKENVGRAIAIPPVPSKPKDVLQRKLLATEPSQNAPLVLPQNSVSTAAIEPQVAEPRDGPGEAQRLTDASRSSMSEFPETLSADGMRQYRLNLAREARRYKRYPAIARERGWQGEVIVNIRAASGLSVPMITLGKTSGYAELDAQALEMMENATRLAAVPESLRGRPFVINLPVHYRLDD